MSLEDGVSKNMLEEMRNAFQLFDKNGDGRITVSELEAVMVSLRIDKGHENDVEKMIREADIDGNGTVEWEEFYRMMRKYVKTRKVDEDQEYRDAFTVFDHDGNGYIDRSELKSTMDRLGEQLSDEDVNAMIALADTDGDGRINFDEFKQMMRFRCAQGSHTSSSNSEPSASSNSNGSQNNHVTKNSNSNVNTPKKTPSKNHKAKRIEKT